MLAKYDTSKAIHINMKLSWNDGKSFGCNGLADTLTVLLLTNKLLVSINLSKFMNILLMDASLI
jgi:hypothetical protein